MATSRSTGCSSRRISAWSAPASSGPISALRASPTSRRHRAIAPERQENPDSDVFRITLDPGAVVTFVAELRTDELPQLYLWEPDTYKDTVNRYTLYHGIVLGIPGLLALFLTIVFVVKGTAMFPATAALAWAVLIYLCIDFGFWNQVIDMSPGDDQVWRAGAEAFLSASLVVFTYTYLHLNRWHVRYSHLTIGWLAALVLPDRGCRHRAVGRRRHRAPVDRRHRRARLRPHRLPLHARLRPRDHADPDLAAAAGLDLRRRADRHRLLANDVVQPALPAAWC